MLADMPVLFDTLKKQNTGIYKLLKEQNEMIGKKLATDQSNHDWTERVQDRIDALAVETRVTNYLLAELVAVHKSMLTANIDAERDVIRNEAYNRILNGE